MNFGQALEALKAGKRVLRSSWPTNCYLKLVSPQANSVFTIPTIVFFGLGESTPWLSITMEMLSEDWEILEADKETSTKR